MTSVHAADAEPDPGCPPPEEGQKDMLVCPRCDHESPVDGDWIVVECSEEINLYCPQCSGHIATRGRS